MRAKQSLPFLLPAILLPVVIIASSFSCTTDSIVVRDICILGGGASGTYAAVRLHDLGKTVALIEQRPVLGGHVNTFTDPITSQTVEYGVNQYQDIDAVTEFLDRLDIPYTRGSLGPPRNISYFDFATGKPVSHDDHPRNHPLDAYHALAAEYPYLEDGFFLPDPVPEELLLPFGEYIQRFRIEHVLPSVWVGMGNILTLPTLYVFKDFGLGVLRSIHDGTFVVTTRGNNQEIFDRALDVLEERDVFLSSHVVDMARNESESSDTGGLISICMETPTGKKKLLRAKNLLVAMPPTLDNLAGFDLSADERALFGQFAHVGYYTSLVRIPDSDSLVPWNASLVYENVNPHAPYRLPALPAVYRIIASRIPGLYAVEYGAPHGLPADLVKDEILRAVQTVMAVFNAGRDRSGPLQQQKPELVAFESHSPYRLHVAADAIRSGFYRRLYALQGIRNTFYTGAAFHAHDSSLLWRFTKELIDDIIF